MASVNVIDWIEQHLDHVGKTALEVGSRRYKDHAFLGLRELLDTKDEKMPLVGCDISAGDNVDIIVDLTSTPEDIRNAMSNKTFDTIFCVSVLEHIPDVFSACRNITALLNPGGTVYISVPFIFRYHGYPGDLWRFSPEAIKFLFPEIDFRDYQYSSVSTLEQGDTMLLSGKNFDKLNRFLFRPKSREDKIERKRAKLAGEEVPAYSLAPCMINMLGFKR